MDYPIDTFKIHHFCLIPYLRYYMYIISINIKHILCNIYLLIVYSDHALQFIFTDSEVRTMYQELTIGWVNNPQDT